MILRFPGLLGGALRLLTLFAVVFIRNIPPGMAWGKYLFELNNKKGFTKSTCSSIERCLDTNN